MGIFCKRLSRNYSMSTGQDVSNTYEMNFSSSSSDQKINAIHFTDHWSRNGLVLVVFRVILSSVNGTVKASSPWLWSLIRKYVAPSSQEEWTNLLCAQHSSKSIITGLCFDLYLFILAWLPQRPRFSMFLSAMIDSATLSGRHMMV